MYPVTMVFISENDVKIFPDEPNLRVCHQQICTKRYTKGGSPGGRKTGNRNTGRNEEQWK